MTVKTHLCLCNIQGVGVCTNVSANYMFRPFPVRPSSGWTKRSEEIHNNAKLSYTTVMALLKTNTVIKGKKLDLDLPFACGREYKGLTTLMFQDTPLPANADEKQRCIDIITLTE